MAKIHVDEHEFDTADNDNFIEGAEAVGVPFGCTEGICGTCKCKVVSGAENLSPKNQEEIDFGLDDDERLLCQVKVKSGTVKFKFM